MALRRLFIALTLTAEARHGLAAILGSAPIPGRVTGPPNWHVTLRYIGDADELETDRLVRALDESDLGSHFRVSWGALGAFPRSSKATVLWIGLSEGESQTMALASRVESAVTDAGLPAEDRPFRPHLTLSRIRPPLDVTDVVEAVPPAGVAMLVDRVVLMESHLGRGGARYELLESFDLARSAN